jgi:hypothetical protein
MLPVPRPPPATSTAASARWPAHRWLIIAAALLTQTALLLLASAAWTACSSFTIWGFRWDKIAPAMGRILSTPLAQMAGASLIVPLTLAQCAMFLPTRSIGSHLAERPGRRWGWGRAWGWPRWLAMIGAGVLCGLTFTAVTLALLGELQIFGLLRWGRIGPWTAELFFVLPLLSAATAAFALIRVSHMTRSCNKADIPNDRPGAISCRAVGEI